jgi:hypothetical protein
LLNEKGAKKPLFYDPLGPVRNQIIRPINGNNTINKIHKAFAPAPAELLATLIMAQIIINSQIRPNTPDTSNPNIVR